MSTSRACEACRAAKARCDLRRPSCGRCIHRRLRCQGYPSETGLIFRNENTSAQRASERARRPRRNVAVAQAPLEFPPSQSDADILPQESLTGNNTDRSTADLSGQFPWLNEQCLATLPEPLRRDKETRAVDRFFIDWTLHPANDGTCPGHLQDLPMLYLSAPQDSALYLAVRAVAFAGMKGTLDGDIPFHTKARQTYGSALGRLRIAAADEQKVSNDRLLAAVLLIDNFEEMFLARSEPLGPHNDAVKHILLARGEQQFHSRHSFALWRIAHHRLQSRQTLLREEPDWNQISWMNKLNTEMPDIHLSADVLHMNIFCAAVKKLTQDHGKPFEQEDTSTHAERLTYQIKDLLASIDRWANSLSAAWKPWVVDSTRLSQPAEINGSTYASLPTSGPTTLMYRDIWLNYMWNWHSATQIVLRESLVELIKFNASIQQRSHSEIESEWIRNEYQSVSGLSDAIIKSIPQLVGFALDSSPSQAPQHRGTMAGRYFLLFSSWVIQRATYTPPEHKEQASKVLDWITSSYELF